MRTCLLRSGRVVARAVGRATAWFGILSLTIGTRLPGQSADHTWGFTSARVDSYSANFIYTGYGYRSTFVLGALLLNPRTAYSELIAGIGMRLRSDSSSTHFVVAAAAKASDSRYLQIYYLPSLRLGETEIEATIQAYQPLDAAGAVQYYVTPLSVTRRLVGRFAGGLSYELAKQSGLEARHFIGPTMRARLGSAQAAVELYAGVRNAPGKTRFAFRVFY